MAPSLLIPPSAMSGTRPPAASRQVDERLHLRHAEVGVQPRRAAATGPDADLDAVDASIEQEPHALSGRHVARNQLDVAELRPEGFDGPAHHGGVAVGDVDDDDVGARPQELRRALEIVAFGADRRANSKATVIVARREGESLLLDADPSR